VRINFVVDTMQGGTKKAAPSCKPESDLVVDVAGMKVTCSSKGFSSSSGSRPPTPIAGLAALTKLVSSIALLKDPFRTNLLTDLADASDALSNKKPDVASASIGDFITQVQARPLGAQLTAAQRGRLLDLATIIRSQLAGDH
jgi:hypothetical protein